MTGMQIALDRLDAAIERKEGILIYGDYDVDGTTAIVILKTAIELCGGAADFHVPHRIREGYGMKDDVIERVAAAGIRLIISVDTGIRAFAAAETAERLGIDLVVTAGQVANDTTGAVVADEIEGQTRQVLDNIRACLAAAGCTLADVIKVNAFLTDLGNFDVYNAVYREYFSEPYPARTTVGAALAPGLLVEVEVIARRPG